MSAVQPELAVSETDRVARANGDYQRQLAETLRRILGPTGAVRACQAYGWDGVIQYLLPEDSETAEGRA